MPLFLSKLRGMFKKNNLPKTKKEMYGFDNLDDEVIGYPPNPAGIPVVQDNVVFSRMNKDILAMRNELGLTEKQFNSYLLPILVELTKFVHLLPASEYHHHCSGGGLIYHSFDVALRTIRHVSMAQFPSLVGGTSDTQQAIHEWKTATVIAGLLHDVGKAITDVVVHNGKEGKEKIVWNPDGLNSITEWAYENKIERYFVSWTPERQKASHKNASASIAGKLIPQATLEWIGESYDGKAIRSIMFEAIAGESYNHIVSRIVALCDAESIKRDFYTRNSHITKDVKRTPLSLMLTDLIRFFIMKGTWAVNKKNAKVWYVDNELYIVWSLVVPELIDELERGGFKLPESPDFLARTMIEEQAAVGNGDSLYFSIHPEILRDAKNPKKLTVLKILDVEKVLLQPDKIYSIGEHFYETKETKELPTQPIEDESKEVAEHAVKHVSKHAENEKEPQIPLSDAEEEAKPENVEFYLETAKNTVKRLLNIHKKKKPTVPSMSNDSLAQEYAANESMPNYEEVPLDAYYGYEENNEQRPGEDFQYQEWEQQNVPHEHSEASKENTGDIRRDIHRKELNEEDEPECSTKTLNDFESFAANYIVDNIDIKSYEIENGVIILEKMKVSDVIYSLTSTENVDVATAKKMINDSQEVRVV